MNPNESLWNELLKQLHSDLEIKNWTIDNGFLDKGNFRIKRITSDSVDILLESNKIIKVPKNDFEYIWSIWDKYMKGEIHRPEIRDTIRTSKYVISIIHWFFENRK